MLRRDKERIVGELTDRLRATESLIVTDYRGLSVSEIDELRTRLLEAGARFSVVKNTLTRLAAEAAGATQLLELLDGPTAIAFVQPDGDPVAVAKVLSETARAGRVLVVRGGVLEGRPVADSDVEELAKLPSVQTLRGQVLGAVVAPLNAIAALVNAPLQDLVGLIDARIEQLGGEAPAEGEAEAAAPTEREAQAASEETEEEEQESASEVEEAAEPEAEAQPSSDDDGEPQATAAAETASEEPREE